jgi:hypothetical protein
MANYNENRFEVLLNRILNEGELEEIDINLSEEEKEFFKDVDMTEVLFI